MNEDSDVITTLPVYFMEITTFKDRVAYIVQWYGGKQSQAAQEINVSRSLIADVITGRKESLNSTSLAKFYRAGWNLNWIATGEGSPRLPKESMGKKYDPLQDALDLLEIIQPRNGGSKEVEIAEDIDEIRLIQLLLSKAKHRRDQ